MVQLWRGWLADILPSVVYATVPYSRSVMLQIWFVRTLNPCAQHIACDAISSTSPPAVAGSLPALLLLPRLRRCTRRAAALVALHLFAAHAV